MRTSNFALLGFALVAAAAGGCGETSAPAFEADAATDGTVGDAAPDAAPDAPPDAAPDSTPDSGSTPCPASLPASGSACAKDGLECQYGSDPRSECRTLATCQGKSWQLTDAPTTCTGAPTCPASQPSGSCAPPGMICGYGDVSCVCSCGPLCGPGSTGNWACLAVTPGCPATPANAGTTCATSGLSCRYQCGPGGARACAAGLWTTADGGPCPISTRKAKHDIVYLGDAEADRVASDVQSMRLASWRYDAPLDDGRQHMGIVLEDQRPGSYAVDARSSMVDLYGYSSMLLAAVQSQKRQIDKQQGQIDALRAEMDALRAELRRGKR